MSEDNPVSPPPQGEIATPEPVLYKVKSKIAYLTINTKMNSISIPTAKLLVKYLQQAEEDSKVRVVVIKTAGDRIFSAGFDLAMFKNGFTEQIKTDLLTHGRDVSRTIFFMSKPVIAQIQGSAIGLGCIISLSVDFRIVADKEEIFFQLPELDLNIFPATGPTAMAIYTLGTTHATDMLLTARKVSLQEMNSWGAITKIVEPEKLGKEVKKFARSLTEKNPMLLQLVKPTIRMMGFEKARSWYNLENEMADYHIGNLMGHDTENVKAFLTRMWGKYAESNPYLDPSQE